MQTENRFPQRRVSATHEYDPPENTCSTRPLDLDADAGRPFYAGGSSARLDAWIARRVAERRAGVGVGAGTTAPGVHEVEDTAMKQKHGETTNGGRDATAHVQESSLPEARVLYVGDSLRSDLASPRVSTRWQLCAIVPELAYSSTLQPQIARDGLPLRQVESAFFKREDYLWLNTNSSFFEYSTFYCCCTGFFLY